MNKNYATDIPKVYKFYSAFRLFLKKTVLTS